MEEWAENNLPGWGGAGMQMGVKGDSGSFDSVVSTFQGKASQASLSAEPVTRKKTERRLSVKSNMSRVSTR